MADPQAAVPVAEWLRAHADDLSEHAPRFREAGLESLADVLARPLTPEDFREMGIKMKGRKLIEHYVAETLSRGGGASAAVCTRPQFRLSAAAAQPAMSVLQRHKLTAREFGGHGAEPKPAVHRRVGDSGSSIAQLVEDFMQWHEEALTPDTKTLMHDLAPGTRENYVRNVRGVMSCDTKKFPGLRHGMLIDSEEVLGHVSPRGGKPALLKFLTFLREHDQAKADEPKAAGPPNKAKAAELRQAEVVSSCDTQESECGTIGTIGAGVCAIRLAELPTSSLVTCELFLPEGFAVDSVWVSSLTFDKDTKRKVLEQKDDLVHFWDSSRAPWKPVRVRDGQTRLTVKFDNQPNGDRIFVASVKGLAFPKQMDGQNALVVFSQPTSFPPASQFLAKAECYQYVSGARPTTRLLRGTSNMRWAKRLLSHSAIEPVEKTTGDAQRSPEPSPSSQHDDAQEWSALWQAVVQQQSDSELEDAGASEDGEESAAACSRLRQYIISAGLSADDCTSLSALRARAEEATSAALSRVASPKRSRAQAKEKQSDRSEDAVLSDRTNVQTEMDAVEHASEEPPPEEDIVEEEEEEEEAAVGDEDGDETDVSPSLVRRADHRMFSRAACARRKRLRRSISHSESESDSESDAESVASDSTASTISMGGDDWEGGRGRDCVFGTDTSDDEDTEPFAPAATP